MGVTMSAAQVSPFTFLFFMRDTHWYLVEVVLEKQYLENRTSKTFKQFSEFQEAIMELDTQSQCSEIAGKSPKGIPVNATKYQT